MITKYIVKVSATDQPVGVMHFVEQARIKVGGNKSSIFTIEHVFTELTGAEAESPFYVGNGKVVHIHDAKSVEELNVKVSSGLENLASDGWYIYKTTKLGRMMR